MNELDIFINALMEEIQDIQRNQTTPTPNAIQTPLNAMLFAVSRAQEKLEDWRIKAAPE